MKVCGSVCINGIFLGIAGGNGAAPVRRSARRFRSGRVAPKSERQCTASRVYINRVSQACRRVRKVGRRGASFGGVGVLTVECVIV